MSIAADSAYRALRDRIFNGEYRPGDRLKERDICTELDVSRTPVREALRRLEADGLVVIEPRRGGVVADLSADEAAEIYELGAILESFAARLAASRGSDEQLAPLAELVADMRACLERDDEQSRAEYMRLDSEFHNGILDLSGNRRLAAMLQQIVGIPVLVKAFHRYSLDDLWQSYQQHRLILAALQAHDPDWAASAMTGHILAARSIMLPGKTET